jgi:outer membrane protein insertion porin family
LSSPENKSQSPSEPLISQASTTVSGTEAARSTSQDVLPETETNATAVLAESSDPVVYTSTQAADLVPVEAPLEASANSPTQSPQTTDLDIAQFSGGGGPGQFRFYLGTELPFPTTLYGATRRVVAGPVIDRRSGFSIPGGVQFGLTDSDFLTLELRAGISMLGADFSYLHDDDGPLNYSVNLFNQRAYSSNLRGGDRDVDLPGGDTPWVHRLGVGAEVAYEFTPVLEGALGLTYQRVSVRDDMFSNDLFAFDEFGNRLTVSDDGQDDLLTLGIVGEFDTRDDVANPAIGTRARVGLEQAFALDDENITFTQLTGNVSQFIPLSLFGFAEGPRTLVLNLQAGHILDDVPSYEAYSLGGSSSVRGYNRGEIGTSTSYIQASAEYRFPIFAFNALNDVIDVGGLIFIDYATALDAQDEVIGRPGEVRNKPGDGLGFGVGLRAISPFGPVRLEFGLTDSGESAIHFNLGDRF